jgi:signal transduction histidine kinase
MRRTFMSASPRSTPASRRNGRSGGPQDLPLGERELASPIRALGLSPRTVGAGMLALAVPPAGVAFLCGAGPIAAAAASAATLLGATVLLQRGCRYLTQELVRPVLRLTEAVRDLSQGRAQDGVRAAGVPLMQLLTESVNGAAIAVDQRSRVSQASLISAEAAFDRIHAVLHSLTEGVILVDRRANVVLANPCARRLMADRDRPIEGQPLSALLTSDFGAQVMRAFASLEGGGEAVQLMGVQHGERVFDVSIVSAMSGKLGVGFGTVIALVDVTRNHEISRLKDQFLSSISHELRTPLTNICAFSEILGQVTPANEKDWREFVAIVGSESQRLRHVVEDLLESTRLLNGEVRWNIETLAIGDLAHHVAEQCALRAAQKCISLSCAVAAGDLRASGDREGVENVIERLLDNAIKFTPEGGCIEVRVSSLGDAVDVAIHDSGRGVRLEDRETVFERFRQIGDHLTEKPRGAGLGLPICRGTVDGMGGSIWCEDSDLGGATFRFVLPSVS